MIIFRVALLASIANGSHATLAIFHRSQSNFDALQTTFQAVRTSALQVVRLHSVQTAFIIN